MTSTTEQALTYYSLLEALDELEEAVEEMELAYALECEHSKYLGRKVEEQKAYITALEKGMELYEETIKKLERKAKRNGVSELFTQEEIDSILQLYFFWGYTQEEIAQKFGTSQQRISEVVNRHVTKGKNI